MMAAVMEDIAKLMPTVEKRLYNNLSIS